MDFLSTNNTKYNNRYLADIITHQIVSAVIMLGSNDNAKYNIDLAVSFIKCRYTIQYLQYHISADHTKRSQRLYHNLALIIYLDKSISLQEFIVLLKDIERYCGRDNNKNSHEFDYLVAMDIDAMAVQLYCNKIYHNISKNWIIIQDRLPFKEHEKICLADFMDIY